MAFRKLAATAAVLSASMSLASPAHAGMDPWIGEIMPTTFSFCPRGWAPANGQLLSVSEYGDLFAYIGVTFGGDGRTNFALPDLRGRAATGQGTFRFTDHQGTTQTVDYAEGQQLGSESITMTPAQNPSHTHTATLRAVALQGNTTDPTDNSMAEAPPGLNMYSTLENPTNNMNAGDVVLSPAGSGAAVRLTSPALTMNYCIALQGTKPFPN